MSEQQRRKLRINSRINKLAGETGGRGRGKRGGWERALGKSKMCQFPSSCIAERDLRGYIEIGRYSILYIALDST
jgi:hypothetical protein